jgi:quercetin dioxygenase-like cupin family protein
MDPVVKNLDSAEKSWTFLDGSKRSAVILESVAIGRGEYLPGWRWSLHAGKQTGKSSAAHVGYVLSGRMAVRAADGKENTVGPGEAFEVGPGHDAWVVGNELCVALDFEHLN